MENTNSTPPSPRPSPTSERLACVLIFGTAGAEVLGVYLPWAGVSQPQWLWVAFGLTLAVAMALSVLTGHKANSRVADAISVGLHQATLATGDDTRVKAQ